ncbi:MAG: hypothetical protein B9S38_15540 [Verrucomicrobiia bacterium Tous-C4TDCM]|nr:MAG: hypothetical protein B9S38_15540 [Verrucomicrobiae bacterium Tous-C4TDCM]
MILPGEGAFIPVSENFDHLVQELTAAQNALYGYILTLLPDRVAAQDVLQEVSLTAWKKRAEFREGTSFLAWASRIAYYHVLTHRRKMSRDRLVLADDVLDYLAERQGERVEENDLRGHALKRCLEKLPETQRRLIERRYEPDGSVQRLAEEAGKSVGAVSQALFRVRQALLRCVEETLAKGETS